MNHKPALHIITSTHRPVVDIYANWRAEIAKRDWGALHANADKREPVDIPETRKRVWRLA
jgi:hypothetical protein